MRPVCGRHSTTLVFPLKDMSSNSVRQSLPLGDTRHTPILKLTTSMGSSQMMGSLQLKTKKNRDTSISTGQLGRHSINAGPDGRRAGVKLPRKLAFHAAHVLLGDEPRADLLFHGARLLLGPAEQQQSGREPIEPVDRPQVAQIVLLGQDERHRVVPVPAARVNLFVHRKIT